MKRTRIPRRIHRKIMKGRVFVIVGLLFGVAACHPLQKLLPLKAPCSIDNCAQGILECLTLCLYC